MPSRARAKLKALLPEHGAARVLVINELLRMFGHGVIFALLPLYLVKFGGLSPSHVAYAAGIGSVIGTAGSLVSGPVVDRIGSKPVAVFCKVGQGLAIVALCWTGGFLWVISAYTVMIAMDTSAAVSGGALVAHALAKTDRVKVRAYLRAVANVGLTAGVACGGLALAMQSKPIDILILAGGGVLSAGSAIPISRLETAHPTRKGGRKLSMTVALRDKTYVIIVSSYLVMTLSQFVLTLWIPLYLVSKSAVPTWWYSPLLIANAALIIILQTRLSRSAEDPKGARVALLKSGYVYALAMVVLLAFSVHETVIGLVSLLIFVVLLTFGEIYQAAAGWGLSYGLAPEDSHGSYQALFAMVSPVGSVLGPFLVGALLIPHPRAGLLVFGAAFAGLAVVLQMSRGFAERASIATAALVAEGAS